jgi:hypothetical protein
MKLHPWWEQRRNGRRKLIAIRTHDGMDSFHPRFSNDSSA